MGQLCPLDFLDYLAPLRSDSLVLGTWQAFEERAAFHCI